MQSRDQWSRFRGENSAEEMCEEKTLIIEKECRSLLLQEIIMKIKALGLGFFFVVMIGCNGGNKNSPQTPATPSPPGPAQAAAKSFRVTGVQKMDFPNGDSALVLNYETDIPIENKESLRKEVNIIWQNFQKDVEKANVKSGVIRATHYEGTGFVRQGKGFGFVFTKGDDGNWQLHDNNKEKK